MRYFVMVWEEVYSEKTLKVFYDKGQLAKALWIDEHASFDQFVDELCERGIILGITDHKGACQILYQHILEVCG